MSKIPPYEVPAADQDLLDCGAALTPQRFTEAGYHACGACGEPVPPMWGKAPGFCSPRCKEVAAMRALMDGLLAAELRHEITPCPLHPLEAALLNIELTNRFREAHHDIYVEVDPRQGFHVRVEGRDYVGAKKASVESAWHYPSRTQPPTTAQERAVLDAMLTRTIVPFCMGMGGNSWRGGFDRPETRGTSFGAYGSYPARLPKNHDPDVMRDLVWARRVFRGETFVEIGRRIGRSGQRVRGIYREAYEAAYRAARRQVTELPRPKAAP
jgi:hypothetical protein